MKVAMVETREITKSMETKKKTHIQKVSLKAVVKLKEETQLAFSKKAMAKQEGVNKKEGQMYLLTIQSITKEVKEALKVIIRLVVKLVEVLI